MAKVTALPQRDKPTFNPQASYKWEPTDVFEITGHQLALLYHCLMKEANSTEGATPAQKYEAYNVALDVLKRGVEQGAIKEMDAPIEVLAEEVEENVTKLFERKDTNSHHHNHPHG